MSIYLIILKSLFYHLKQLISDWTPKILSQILEAPILLLKNQIIFNYILWTKSYPYKISLVFLSINLFIQILILDYSLTPILNIM